MDCINAFYQEIKLVDSLFIFWQFLLSNCIIQCVLIVIRHYIRQSYEQLQPSFPMQIVHNATLSAIQNFNNFEVIILHFKYFLVSKGILMVAWFLRLVSHFIVICQKTTYCLDCINVCKRYIFVIAYFKQKKRTDLNTNLYKHHKIEEQLYTLLFQVSHLWFIIFHTCTFILILV